MYIYNWAHSIHCNKIIKDFWDGFVQSKGLTGVFQSPESQFRLTTSWNFSYGFRLLVSSNPLHCKDKMPKIRNKSSQKRNIGASVPISTFMCLWANYIFPRWVCLFCWRKYVDRSWEYINRSQIHECGNWGWGRAIHRKGIYKRSCRCSAWIWPILVSPLPGFGHNR
jgi:hypothetical protein